MTRCEFPFETLSAYVDGQLETNEELEVRRHLDGCARCSEVVESLSVVNEALASTTEVHPVPHSLRSRVNQARVSGRPTSWNWGTAAVAAVLLATLTVVRWQRQPDTGAVDQLTQALLEDHVRYLSVADALQVASSDPRRIADSFSDRVGFPIQLPQLSNASLLGGRFCWIKRNKALLSFYQMHGQRLSIFAISQNALPPDAITSVRCATSGRYEVCLLPAAPELLALVGDSEQARAILPEFERFRTTQSQQSKE
jgi:anti-sigma factor RsiW